MRPAPGGTASRDGSRAGVFNARALPYSWRLDPEIRDEILQREPVRSGVAGLPAMFHQRWRYLFATQQNRFLVGLWQENHHPRPQSRLTMENSFHEYDVLPSDNLVESQQLVLRTAKSSLRTFEVVCTHQMGSDLV